MLARCFVASLTAFVIAGAASAATLKVPSTTHPTIVGACAAAVPGDVIEIKAGKYADQIAFIVQHGITVRGKGKVVIDAQTFGNGIMIVDGGDIQIENIEVRNASSTGVLLSSCANVRLKKVRAVGSQFHGFACLDSVGLWLSQCVAIDSAASGFKIDADQSYVRQCGVFGATEHGMVIDGDGNVVAQCKIKDVSLRGIHLLDASGSCDANVLTDNIITDTGGAGIYASGQGDGNVVRRNKIKHSLEHGMFIDIDGTVLADNRVSATKYIGLRISCRRSSILGNTVTQAGTAGIYLNDNSDNSTVLGNSVKGAADVGFDLRGNPLTFGKNTAKGCVNGPVSLGPSAGVNAFENGFAFP